MGVLDLPALIASARSPLSSCSLMYWSISSGKRRIVAAAASRACFAVGFTMIFEHARIADCVRVGGERRTAPATRLRSG